MDQYEWDKMSPKTRDKYLEIMRNMPPGKKMRLAMERNDAVSEWVRAGIRAHNPGISEEEVRKQLIKRILPPDIVKKVYGW